MAFAGRHAPDWRGAPLIAESLGGVAPALVLVAGYDVLRDEGIAYAERLCAEGVQATLVEYAGLAHGFISMSGAMTGARLAVDQVASALRLALRHYRKFTTPSVQRALERIDVRWWEIWR